MSESATLLDSLVAWPGLWRHPRLFAVVHGASETPPSARDLLAALLEAEPAELAEAWAVIAESADLAATQAAYDRLSPAIKKDKLTLARRAFEGRADQVEAQAHPLPPTVRAGVLSDLRKAREASAADPLAAELALRRAAAQAIEGEARALALLRQTSATALAGAAGADAGTDSRALRLRRALEDGDLRLAQILAGQFGGAGSGTKAGVTNSLLHDPWFDRHSTADLLRWRRDPVLAPAGRLPVAALADQDLILLTRLERLLQSAETGGGEVSAEEADDLLRLTVWSLSGAAAPAGAITPLVPPGDDVWVFNLVGATARYLFPHAVESAAEGAVAVIIPRRPVLHFPAGPPGRRFVAFDVFERWQPLAKPGAVLMTPRMLVQALGEGEGEGKSAARANAFVRLQSAAIGVRPLIMSVLGRDEARCRLLIGAPPLAAGALSAEEVIQPLAQALDLYVDDGDLAALVDACGDQLPLLLEILHILAETLDSAPPAHRRFNALGTLARPEVADQIESLIVGNLRRRLAERLTEIALAVDAAGTVLDSGATESSLGDGIAGVSATDLADRLVVTIGLANAEEARTLVDELCSLGLLQLARASPAARSPLIRPNLPLPGRILRRLDN